MALAARTGFIGLVTNVACTQAPEGALQEAENVALRRAGCIEPRDGTSLLESTAEPAVWGFSIDDDNDAIAMWDDSAFDWKLVGGAALTYTDPVTGAEDPQPMRRDILTYARSRGNVYVPYAGGVLRLSASGFATTGVPPYASIVAAGSTSGGSWFPNNTRVGYRLVTVHEVDRLILRSVPSGMKIAQNTSGGALRGSVTIYAKNGMPFSYVEVYRTGLFSLTTTIDDEMRLVRKIPASSFSLGLATFNDDVAPEARGAALYTSPSRGGARQANTRPPAAAAIAAFKGSMFFGNTRSPRRITVSYNYAGAISTATGIGTRTYTGTHAIGSNQITSLSSTTGLEKGQYVATIGGAFPLGTHVTNISGTTATVSQNATANGTGSVEFVDALRIDGDWIPVTDLFPYFLGQIGDESAFVTSVTPPEGGFSTTLAIEAFTRKTTAMDIKATHGGEYSPVLPGYDAAALALEQDVYPGAIFWSKKDEPEHVPITNYEFVGDKSKAILGLVPTRDALYVLKEDGVFRLTGSGATIGNVAPWRIDPFDPTTRCLLPTSVRPLNGRAYFLSNKGVVAFGDDGAEQISKPVHDLVRDEIDQVTKNFLANGFYELTSVVGSTAAVFERENEYTLLRSNSLRPLVYNENTRGWSMWRYASHASESLAYSAVYSLERQGRVAYALNTRLVVTRLSTDAQLGAMTLPAINDGETAVTATGAVGAAVTLSAPVTALADDVIEDAAGKLWRLLATTIADTTLLVGGAEGTFTTGSCVLYRSLRCRVAPQTFHGPPMIAKLNSPLTAVFSRFHGPAWLSYLYSSQLSELDWDSWTELEVSFPRPSGYALSKRGVGYPQDVPDDHARAWLLDAGVRWVMTHGVVRLEGAYLESRSMAARSRAQDGV